MRLVVAAAIRFQMMMPMLIYGNLTNAFLLVTSLYCMQVQGHFFIKKLSFYQDRKRFYFLFVKLCCFFAGVCYNKLGNNI